jgi:hypothetical protein
MTYLFLNQVGMEGYGQTNATLIGLTMGIQMILAFIQNSSEPFRFLRECLVILTGFKPAYDAWRVGSGADAKDHHVFSPLTEMTYCKSIETVFEAIPSSIVQIYALVISGGSNRIAMLSILISAATTAFTSVMISYDWDTSPTQRATNNKNIKFYGFVPDRANPRFLCFTSMFIFTTAHTLARAFSCSLLAIVNRSWLLRYLVLDFFLFCAIKWVRSDLRYGVNATGVTSYVLTFFIRFADKFMTDFVALMQVRHPGECGGLLWTLCLVWSQISCVACGWIYLKYAPEALRMDAWTVWGLIGSLIVVFLIGAGSFLYVCNREFIQSFFSTDTYATYNRKWFTGIDKSDEAQRSKIFDVHPDYRCEIEGEIRAWTLANWERWETQKPVWFTENWIESVSNDCIPFKFCVKYRKTKGRQDVRRGSVSIKEMLGGGPEAR